MAAVDLLLVGRTGNGKSSTGNSILGKRVFVPRSSGPSGFDEIAMGIASIEGKNVTVVDGLGFGDTDNETDNVKNVIDRSKNALSHFPNGFTALIICLKYGLRFTQQERDTVKMIRSIFGEDVIKKHGIIVMTHGDSFDLDTEDDGITFDAWCQDQAGDVRDLFRECSNRYVLFNNRAKNSNRLEEQNKILMSKVAEIRGKYTKDDYKKAEFGRTKLIVGSKLPQLERRTTEFVDRITREVRKVDDSHYTPKDKLFELDRIKLDITNFKKQLEDEDQGTQSITQLLLQISITESTIRTKTERIKFELNRQAAPEVSPPAGEGFTPNQQMVIGLIVIAVVLYTTYKISV